MMTGWIFTEQGPIENMGEPCERVPITGMPGGKCPADLRPGQTSFNMRVRGDVIRIVIINELEGADPRKRGKSDDGQQAANYRRMTDPFSPGGLGHRLTFPGLPPMQAVFSGRRKSGKARRWLHARS